MKTRKTLVLVSVLMALMLVFAACSGGSATTDEKKSLNDMTMDEIIAQAKEEGRIDTVGMPDDWANYGNLFAAVCKEYGLEHTDIDMSSSEQLALFEAEKDSPTKDMGEVGQQHYKTVMDKGLAQPYKPTTWDSIPDWAKDDDGYWIIAYTGSIAIIVNTDKVGEAPKTFADILKGDYMVTIGDPATESSAQNVVLAAAYAMGGDVNNLQPGIDFFVELAKAGRLDPGSNEMNRLAKGESVCVLHWDYKLINYKQQILADDPNMNLEIHVPTDGTVSSGYITPINAYAPHPAAAALCREWLFSDEGQNNVALTGARPVRDVELSDEAKAVMLPEEEYVNAHPTIEFIDDWIAASETLGTTWSEQVVPYM